MIRPSYAESQGDVYHADFTRNGNDPEAAAP